MGNKLKKIFTDTQVSYGGNIQFDSNEAREDFKKALEQVWREEKTVEIEGVKSIITGVKDGNKAYPLIEADKIDKMIVAPAVEKVSFSVNTRLGEKVLQLNRYYISDSIVLATEETAIVYMKLVIRSKEKEHTFTYKTRVENAKSVEEVLENFYIAKGFVDALFKPESGTFEEAEFVLNMKKTFADTAVFFEKVKALEDLLKIKFNISKRNPKENDEQEIEELFALLMQSKIFRYNAKLSSIDGIELAIPIDEVKNSIGNKILMTFTGNIGFNVFGREIELYTCNVVFNAIIKNVKAEDGKTKIWYADTAVEPMYISYSAFLNVEQRDNAMKEVTKNISRYEDAETVESYISQVV